MVLISKFNERVEGRIYNGYPIVNNARITYFVANILRGLADLIYGVRSGYPSCCIYAYVMKQERYYVKGIQRVLCRKCYLKYYKEEGVF